MTAKLIKAEKSEVVTYEGIFGESLIERFAKFAGVSELSRQTYTKCLKQLLKYFKANSIAEPTRENLIEWIDELKATRAASTVQLYVTATKIFFRWMAQEKMYLDIADHLKTGIKPSHKHKKDALTTDQCAELIKNCKVVSKINKVHNEVAELRDKAILSLMATAGLRTIEVVRANIGDIRFERGKIFLYVQGKGHADADEKVLLAKQTYRAINVYLKARGKAQASDPLFVSTSRSNFGQRLQTQSISRMVKRELRANGLDSVRLTAHSLRHSVATNLVFAGVELPKIQMIMRHVSINTTMIYADAWQRYQNDGEQMLADDIFGH